MTVHDALKQCGEVDGTTITYRMWVPVSLSIRVRSVLVGRCRFVNGELESMDGDSYSLDEEIEDYDYRPGEMTVYIGI